MQFVGVSDLVVCSNFKETIAHLNTKKLLIHSNSMQNDCSSNITCYTVMRTHSLLTELLAMSPQDRGPCTPCSSLDPSALSMDEIRIIRQVQVATTMDPAQLAEELANISSTGEYKENYILFVSKHWTVVSNYDAKAYVVSVVYGRATH